MKLSSFAALGLCAFGPVSLAGATTHTVQQINITFSPTDVVIQVGDTVQWQWNAMLHTVTEGTDGTVDGDEAFHSPLTSSTPTFEVTFDADFLACNPRPNDHYDYFCEPHFSFGMTGTVTVQGVPGAGYCDCDQTGTAPCGNAGGCGVGCANSTGLGGKLRGTGSAGVSADDLVLTGTNLRPNQPALLFAGNNAVAMGNGAVFGDGLRCAGGGVVRLGVKIPNPAGSASWGPGLAATAGWSAGSTRFLQGWYRDPGGSPCGSNFNLTNGYQVDLLP